MKIGLIGMGYWGKILINTLKEKVKSIDAELVTCDLVNPSADTKLYTDLKHCNKVFIATPVNNHSKLCRFFLSKGIDVFCEKPLVLSSMEAEDLYILAEKNNCYLFVDWIFLFNNQVNLIRKFIKDQSFGRLKSITMNRLNLGPVRTDVSAKYDLASHDISIVLFLLNRGTEKGLCRCRIEPLVSRVHWIGYKRNNSSKINDSCYGLIQIDNVTVQINASWHYGKKDRLCIFEFEDGFLMWDDHKKALTFNEQNYFEQGTSPLYNSIDAFMNFTHFKWKYVKKSRFFDNNKKLTINVLKVLEVENTFY